ncbi:cache domain-containing protein [Thauera linaloolentis]|nr:cache domain-containing protein [Thauera linaloolentis]MCM8564496.1 cache domain-containing protein [Thauera linaloolentis]
MGGLNPPSGTGGAGAPRPRRWRHPLRPRSVRARLLALVLAPLLLGVPVLLGIVWLWGTQGYNQLLVNKVSADLLTARQYFDRVQDGFSASLEGFAASHQLALALERRDDARTMAALLETTAARHGLDYLILLDRRGRFASGTAALPPSFADRSDWPAVREALSGHGRKALAVFSAAHLEALSPALRERALLALIDTPNAAPDARSHEERGLMVQVAVPVTSANGTLLGVLEGGAMLNRNLAIVDRLNAVVYHDTSLPHDSQGTATLFLGDTRVATNVRLQPDDVRALGTRVSAAVRDKVLIHGENWLGSALVIDTPYVSGYAPLVDGRGERIGMLYVGFLQASLETALHRALGGLFLAFLLVSALGAVGAIQWARSIFRPIKHMAGVMRRIEQGEDSARVGPAAGRDDELGQLARAFDALLDKLDARRSETQRWADELDSMVAARTAELEDANATLRRARQQLVMNEKLTAIGELTAGVAHEINNPVAVIQGNLELLREILGHGAEPVRDEIRAIDEQIRRIQGIVAKLLQFARPGDFAGYTDDEDVNALIRDCLVLTRHNLSRAHIEVHQELLASRSVEINRGELQQVLINLIVNAMQAMPEGGTLRLRTGDTTLEDGAEGVRIQIEDNGHGIASALLDRIFDPFFTTKKQDGTGLGLSISYAIVTRYGGHIGVDSAPGRGARFSVLLRCRPVFSTEPSAPDFARRFFGHQGG